jgi:hypothetical protein
MTTFCGVRERTAGLSRTGPAIDLPGATRFVWISCMTLMSRFGSACARSRGSTGFGAAKARV